MQLKRKDQQENDECLLNFQVCDGDSSSTVVSDGLVTANMCRAVPA